MAAAIEFLPLWSRSQRPSASREPARIRGGSRSAGMMTERLGGLFKSSGDPLVEGAHGQSEPCRLRRQGAIDVRARRGWFGKAVMAAVAFAMAIVPQCVGPEPANPKRGRWRGSPHGSDPPWLKQGAVVGVSDASLSVAPSSRHDPGTMRPFSAPLPLMALPPGLRAIKGI